MNRPLRLVSWVFFTGIMYLILEETLKPWINLPGLGNIGFTVVFVIFALTHCAESLGGRFTGLFFAVSAVASYGMEEIGVRTGLIYGRYHYSDLLGVKLGHVPLVIPLAWFMMIYPSWRVAKELLSGVQLRSISGIVALAAVGAFVMTAWDVVMDPGMAAEGNWVWETGGAYFGVPRHNYLGWLLTTFLVYWIAGWLARSRGLATETRQPTLYDSLPVIVYAFFSFRYVAHSQIPALQLIALFSMGVPSILALARLALVKNNEPSAMGATDGTG